MNLDARQIDLGGFVPAQSWLRVLEAIDAAAAPIMERAREDLGHLRRCHAQGLRRAVERFERSLPKQRRNPLWTKSALIAAAYFENPTFGDICERDYDDERWVSEHSLSS